VGPWLNTGGDGNAVTCRGASGTSGSGSGRRHRFDSSNYTLSDINRVDLGAADRGEKWSPVEIELFHYVLSNKMKYSGKGNISWRHMEQAWVTPAKVPS
jgi:hypothetical protein